MQNTTTTPASCLALLYAPSVKTPDWAGVREALWLGRKHDRRFLGVAHLATYQFSRLARWPMASRAIMALLMAGILLFLL